MKAYEGILNVISILIQAMENSMVLMQSWGYNGHKRKYRLFILLLNHWKCKIKNEMYDLFKVMAPLDHVGHKTYEPKNLKEHSSMWHATIVDAIRSIKADALILFSDTARQSKHICHLLDLLYYEQEKATRWLARANQLNWMEHDLHRQDDEMHEHFKKIEKQIYKELKWKAK